MAFDWRSLPSKGLLLLKAATFRHVAMCATREIKGTEGQILIKVTPDDITLSLANPAEEEDDETGATVRVMCVVQSDSDPPVYTAVPYDLKGDAIV